MIGRPTSNTATSHKKASGFPRLPLPLTVTTRALTLPLFSLDRRAVGSTCRLVSVDLKETCDMITLVRKV